MEHDLVLEGRVVTPRGVEDLEVGVSDGKISELKKQGLKGSKRLRTGRALIFPGFVDVHVHLREPGWEHKENFRTGTEAAVHGGVTTLADMPNNPNPANTADSVLAKRNLARGKGLVDIRFYGGVRADALGEVKKMAPLVAGYKIYLARSTGGGIFPGESLAEALRAVSATGKPVSLHCEDQGIIDQETRRLSGEERPDVYCDIRPPRAEVSSVKEVVEAMRGRVDVEANICHASTGETLALVAGARAAGLRLRCEAALHHLYFNRGSMLRSVLLRTNPPLREESDRRALLDGVKSGRVSFLVTDHAPHTVEEKAEGAAGVPGLDDYSHLVSWLARDQRVDPTLIARVASSAPAEFLQLDDRGVIAPGKRADITVLDFTPEKVKDEDVRSRCGWSPYEGRVFPGKARWVLEEGAMVMDDGEIIS